MNTEFNVNEYDTCDDIYDDEEEWIHVDLKANFVVGPVKIGATVDIGESSGFEQTLSVKCKKDNVIAAAKTRLGTTLLGYRLKFNVGISLTKEI